MSRALKLATRGSPLALWQAEAVRSALREAHPGMEVALEICKTSGDRNLSQPLSQIGGVGLFTAEIDRAVLDGRADVAVHSLKDCPSAPEMGTVLAGCLERSSPFDAFIPREGGIDFENLPAGSTIATGSLRRRAQLLAARPDLRVAELRGNIETRLRRRREGEIAGVVMAEAALLRLGIDVPHSVFDPDVMVPAVAQGIVGMAVREGDRRSADLVHSVTDAMSFVAARAERGLLGVLQGGCRVPVGAYAAVGEGTVDLRAVVASLDGERVVRDRIAGKTEEAADLGVALGRRMLRQGAGEILKEIRLAGE